MSDAYRRYEVLLPLRFNDGQPIPPDLIAETVKELSDHFGPVSLETQQIRGEWSYGGHLYRDDLVRLFVDLPDLAEHRTFFMQWKERLKARFLQLDIWVTTHPLEVL
jgi:hypothetical protein